LEVATAEVNGLFDKLGAIDCSKIVEIPPDEVIDGGGSRLYRAQYEDGSTCSVWYHEGTTYLGAELLVEPLDDFIDDLTLPPDAENRFILP
jgi:hypothetical protein